MTNTSKYENPQIEPFTIRRLNGATYYRPSHTELAWYKDGIVDTIPWQQMGHRTDQEKLSINRFLTEIPDLCYAPLSEDPQECLVLYLDTEWMSVETVRAVDEGDYKRANELTGSMRTLRATQEAIVAACQPDGHLSEDWMVTLEERLKKELPGATFPIIEAKNKRETVEITRVGSAE